MTTTGQKDTHAFRQEVEECAAFLAARLRETPEILIQLGTR